MRSSKDGARAPQAIQPYPEELEHAFQINGERQLIARPIRPEDEPRLAEMVNRSTEEDVRLRFLGAIARYASLVSGLRLERRDG